MTSNLFEQNMADIGGAISFQCPSYMTQTCEGDFNMNNFNMNEATKSGGAVYYDSYRPENIESNTYSSNTAAYGPEMASFPYRIKRESGSL